MDARARVVAAARSWLGTPYHHRARVKGAGVDCGQLVIASFYEAGLIEDLDPGYYTCDWHLHRNEDRYLAAVESRLVRVCDDTEFSVDDRYKADPNFRVSPGDVLVFRVGRTFSHGGLITEWPKFIHSYLPAGMVEEVEIKNTPMSARPARVYTFEGFQ